jgi:hypothetical protein
MRKRGFTKRWLAIPLITAGLVLPATAAATAPAARYDAPGQRHAPVCARLAAAHVPLRFDNATPSGFSLGDQQAMRAGGCPPGTARLDLHEVLPSPSGPLVLHVGGHGYVDPGSAKYGEVATADIAGGLPAPSPAGGGRGAACTLAAGPPSRVNVQSIPPVMHYKRPQDVASGSNSGTSFMHYGNPGADQGHGPRIDYTYLLWSFVDVHGGGMVRTLLAPGQIVWPCDVQPITMPSWDRHGAVNGSVTARYVRVLAGTCPLYGWMVWSHTYGGAAPVAHVTPLNGSAPPDPQPAPGCPV